MVTTQFVTIIIAAVVIGGLVMLLASTRKSLSGPTPMPGPHIAADGKYPYGYWMGIGIGLGLALGLVLGLAVHSLVGGLFVGLGLGLIAGKVLDRRYDKVEAQYTEEETQLRLRRASWGMIFMILLVLGALLAAILPLLDGTG